MAPSGKAGPPPEDQAGGGPRPAGGWGGWPPEAIRGRGWASWRRRRRHLDPEETGTLRRLARFSLRHRRLVATDGRAALVAVELADGLGEDRFELTPDAIEAELRRLDAPRVLVGGGPLQDQEFEEQVAADQASAELSSMPVVLVLLVPATMKLMGRWNWWAPTPLRRLRRRIGLLEQATPVRP